ncbi:MAG: dockerin type I repeat-containing protein [Oscillospiraceae bacterium]|nr:dockerin type I repeat-containing protein [Oscillospiraceae bacterium]
MKKGIHSRVLASLTALLLLAAAIPFMPAGSTAFAAEKLLAFPGATGAGRYATGGRGGEVYHVTNLNDSGAGSLRDAVSRPNRIVVFDVSGTIELAGNIICSDNITVAGQTAPGGSGITLKNYKFGMGGDNIIVRYLSSRPGPDKCTSSGNDGWGGAKGSYSTIDHCSLGWTTDEQWGLYSNNEYYTVQYSVIGPANSWGGHVKGVHGFGIMMGKGYLSFDHNLIIHNVSRNFRGKTQGTETADFTNNIIYDWGYQTAYGTIGHLNYVNNTLKAGNSTTGGYHWMYVDSTTSPQNFKVYCAGNRMINKDGSFHSITNDNWAGVTVKESIGISKNDLYSASPFPTVLDGENVSTASSCESAAAAYDHVISFAGNGISPDKRTAIDRQCAEETRNGTGQCSGTENYDGSVAELGKYNIKCGVTYQYPAAVTQKEITDADNDGMDDAWELARGLNPNDPSDYQDDYCGQGYMNIEYYINDLTVDSFPEGVVKPSPEDSGLSGIRHGTVMDTDAKYEIVNAATGALLENAERYTLKSGDSGYYQIIRAETGEALSGGEQFKFSRSGSGYVIYTKSSGDTECLGGAGTVWLVTPKLDAIKGTLISVDVLDADYYESWKIDGAAAAGDALFGDRTPEQCAAVSLPEPVNGAELILTPCNAKNSSAEQAALTALRNITLYVGLDSRVEHIPAWLADFSKTGDAVTTTNDVTFDLYAMTMHAGETVTLGANGQASYCMNYIVLAAAADETLRGDVNLDGSVNIADAVALIKFLLSESTLTAEQAAQADINGDQKLSAVDLTLLKRMLLNAA